MTYQKLSDFNLTLHDFSKFEDFNYTNALSSKVRHKLMI